MAEDAIDVKMEISHREKLANLDVLDMVKMIDAAMIETGACNSAGNISSHEQDLITMKGLWAHISERFEAHVDSPHIWLPNYAPTPLQVSGPPELQVVENPTLQHNLNLLAALRTQLIFSNSADRVAGFEEREVTAVLRPMIEKCIKYIDGAIDDLGNPTHNYLPDVNLQDPGVNAGNPGRR